jgi:two-component system cell cycle response regulator
MVLLVCSGGKRQPQRTMGLAAHVEVTRMIKKSLNINQLLAESARLPTMPAVVAQVLAIPEWDNVDLRAVGEIISKDVSLASKVLRVVNSPFYGLPREISSISQALAMLGIRATRSLCLSFSILNISPRSKTSRFDYSGFWMRSLNTASAARELALAAKLPTEEESFLAGLLQNIGAMVLAQCVPRLYVRSLNKAQDKLSPKLEIEREELGTDHVEVAKLLFENWNLPPSLRVPVLYHHEPEKAGNVDEHTLLAIQVQHLAGLIGECLYAVENGSGTLRDLSETAAHYFDISPGEFAALLRRVDSKVEETAGVFEMTASRPDSYASLLQKANEALGNIATEQERLVWELQASKAEAEKLSQQLQAANNKLLEEARKDPLTDLANRRMFQMLLTQELHRSQRYHHAIALLFIDIDDFKLLNDQYGHLEGDRALKHLAEILEGQVRAADVVARYGGEEFIIALVETSESDARIVAERVRAAIAAAPLVLADQHTQVQITASIGIAAWEPPNEPTTVEALVEQADSAMYQSKKAGKNRVSVWEPGSK